VKARGADFRERAVFNWYILRDVCKTPGVELHLVMFSIDWMIGVWGGSPPGDCAILSARWLHFLRFLKQIRKKLHSHFWQFAISPRQSFKLKGHLCPFAPPGEGQRARLPLQPPVPASLVLKPIKMRRKVIRIHWHIRPKTRKPTISKLSRIKRTAFLISLIILSYLSTIQFRLLKLHIKTFKIQYFGLKLLTK
jgi:hypothetical protein